MSGRKDRSRSPVIVTPAGHQEEVYGQNRDLNKTQDLQNVLNLNPMIMANIYQQGNPMLGGMFNVMMPNAMMSGALLSSRPGIDMITQPQMAPAQIGDCGGTGGPSVDMAMMMNPGMMSIYSNINQEPVQEKNEIVLRYCKLIPPMPGSSPPLRRERPPGCRTIFIGGLPDKIREDIIRDIFERYGKIQILRLSKKNFCHVRYENENSVDAAMVLTRYRIKLILDDVPEDENDESRALNGWLHVDYALSRDDQNEYERRQRQAARLQHQQLQHLNAQEAIAAAPALVDPNAGDRDSPPRIQLYSNIAIVQIADRIKNTEHFSSTLPTLITWLERGDCSKKNANQFYSMIQTTNSHMRRLCNEKVQAEDEFLESKERLKNHIQNIIEQLEQVAKVFIAATHQRVWDHFTKSQRKNIETWQKITKEIHTMKEEFYEKFCAEDNESSGHANRMNSSVLLNAEVQELKRENESLRFQLEAYRNEVEVIKADAQKEMDKFKAQFIARQALQGALEKNPPLPSPVVKPPPPPPLPEDDDNMVIEEVEAGCGEAKLIGVMSAFLQVHPQGASFDYVVSYVQALFPATPPSSVHCVLQKHTDVFQQTTSGVGAAIDNRWTFVAFNRN